MRHDDHPEVEWPPGRSESPPVRAWLQRGLPKVTTKGFGGLAMNRRGLPPVQVRRSAPVGPRYSCGGGWRLAGSEAPNCGSG